MSELGSGVRTRVESGGFQFVTNVGEHPIAGGVGKAANLLIGGWSVAGITTLNTGYYGTTGISGGNCNSATNNPCRPDLIANPYAGGKPRGVNGVDSPKFLVGSFDWPENPAHARQSRRWVASPNLPSRFLDGEREASWRSLLYVREQLESFDLVNDGIGA